MFGHPQRVVTSDSHKLPLLNESLGSIRSDTSFAFAHFVPRHPVKDQSRTTLISDEQTCARTGFFLQLRIQERKIMASKNNFTF